MQLVDLCTQFPRIKEGCRRRSVRRPRGDPENEGSLASRQLILEQVKKVKPAIVVSVFLHKVKDRQIDREKVFQLASIIQNSQAAGFFATDTPYGANQLSRFGVEETVVDGLSCSLRPRRA